MPTRYEALPSISQRECVVLPLAAGPAAGASTEQASFVAHRASTILEAHIFPSANVAANGNVATFTLQVGATVIGSFATTAAVGLTAAAGAALTLTAANVNLSDGDVVKVVAASAAGGENLSSTAFYCNVTLRPNL